MRDGESVSPNLRRSDVLRSVVIGRRIGEIQREYRNRRHTRLIAWVAATSLVLLIYLAYCWAFGGESDPSLMMVANAALWLIGGFSATRAVESLYEIVRFHMIERDSP